MQLAASVSLPFDGILAAYAHQPTVKFGLAIAQGLTSSKVDPDSLTTFSAKATTAAHKKILQKLQPEPESVEDPFEFAVDQLASCLVTVALVDAGNEVMEVIVHKKVVPEQPAPAVVPAPTVVAEPPAKVEKKPAKPALLQVVAPSRVVPKAVRQLSPPARVLVAANLSKVDLMFDGAEVSADSRAWQASAPRRALSAPMRSRTPPTHPAILVEGQSATHRSRSPSPSRSSSASLHSEAPAQALLAAFVSTAKPLPPTEIRRLGREQNVAAATSPTRSKSPSRLDAILAAHVNDSPLTSFSSSTLVNAPVPSVESMSGLPFMSFPTSSALPASSREFSLHATVPQLTSPLASQLEAELASISVPADLLASARRVELTPLSTPVPPVP
eukprot:m.109730 g.109730  ORF g.109730 m.109730 type:complete len:387 (+) comp51780_c0_seq2:1470-2630(+)